MADNHVLEPLAPPELQALPKPAVNWGRAGLIGAGLIATAVTVAHLAGPGPVLPPPPVVVPKAQPVSASPRVVTPVAPVAPGQAPAALTVLTAPVLQQALLRLVVGDGSVVAWQELAISIETAGLRVAEVPVEEGDSVRQGQLLVRLDDAVPAAQLDAAEAALVEAVAFRDIALSDFRRSAELARSESVARQVLDQRQSAARQAEARLTATRAHRDEAAARLAQTKVLAPVDGLISHRNVLPGGVVQPGQELVRLIRDSRLELDARIPELDIASVQPGQPVRVRHGEQVIDATVRALSPLVATDSRLGLVHIALPPGSGLKPGMFASAEITPVGRLGLTVPQEAVVFRDGRPAVFVVPPDQDRVTLKPVRTGLRRSGKVEVTEGLAEGERVVVTGAGFLAQGDRVRLGATP